MCSVCGGQLALPLRQLLSAPCSWHKGSMNSKSTEMWACAYTQTKSHPYSGLSQRGWLQKAPFRIFVRNEQEAWKTSLRKRTTPPARPK